MHLKILLPSEIFAEVRDVTRIVVDTLGGSFGILPARLDCVAALEPGILTYETAAEGEVVVAVDQGILTKTGAGVVVSVRRALRGQDLAALRATVDQEFRALNETEQDLRAVMAKLETGFLRRFAEMRHD
ncbi:F0F1 ATP synthase subunit epsilon [bacterium]|nr:F0F1 ATP synthase subunit epsilon [bacterium]